MADRRLDKRGRTGRCGDIRLNSHGPHRKAIEVPEGRLGRLLVAMIVQDDVTAILGEAPSDRLADPFGAAGNYRNPS